MRVRDPIYGEFTLPGHLSELISTPEVRRLSQIRLINTMSPSLATLGELRRYSHTLGVLYLSTKNASPGFSPDEWHALHASVLLHDVATPPFAHLFEYHLQERHGWCHERMIAPMMWGFHAPENRAHQIFGGRAIEFQSALRASRISLELVEQIVKGEHALSALLFGTIDLDNIDNVARMAWALGEPREASMAIRLAEAIRVGRDSRLYLPVRELDAVRSWSSLRRTVYSVLVFDPPTVAAQAVLSEAIGRALASGDLVSDDCWMTDEDLLTELRGNPATKELITCDYHGRLPSMVFCIQIAGSLGDLGVTDREAARSIVEQVLRTEFSGRRVLGYVFVDSGAFEKEVSFVDPDTEDTWVEGRTSKSVVLYGFIRSSEHPGYGRCNRASKRLISELDVSRDRVIRCDVGQLTSQVHEQPLFDIST